MIYNAKLAYSNVVKLNRSKMSLKRYVLTTLLTSQSTKINKLFLTFTFQCLFSVRWVFLVSNLRENSTVTNINSLISSVFVRVNSNLHHRQIEKAAFGRFLTSIFKVRHLNDIILQLLRQSIILFSDAGHKSGSHEANVDLQLTDKMWNKKQKNL